MPNKSQAYRVSGEEVISLVTVNPGSTPGQIVFNQQIGPNSTARLSRLADLWQRIDWDRTTLNIVALNGSLVTSGYNVGFIEDPELTIPDTPSEVIPFLTALRSTSVRQNWVQSESGQTVSLSRLPEMYTTLGSDVRRYFIGRLVMAITGDVTSTASFQIMLRYTVNLYVPRVVLVGPGPGPVQTYKLPQALLGALTEDDSDEPFVSNSNPPPPVGRYVLPDNERRAMYVTTVEAEPRIADVVFVKGFEVTSTVLPWSTGTRYIPDSDPSTSLPWPGTASSNGSVIGPTTVPCWCLISCNQIAEETQPQNARQYVFNRGDVFEYTPTA